MHLRCALALAAALIGIATAVAARPQGCDDSVLPADQRWNGATSYSTPELDRFYSISAEMSAAYKARDFGSADALAREYLKLAKRFPCNWNYGNAIHNANSILGLVALRNVRKAEAVSYLAASGATPGSPQLNTFGPSLRLARELASAGEHAAVASYLSSVKRFWTAKDMSPTGLLFPYFADPDPISTWIKELQRGQVPDFGAPFNADPP
jgi:hypothetical protein